MEKKKTFNLEELIKPDLIDSISGRSLGEDYSKKIKLLELLDTGYSIEFIIDDNVIKAINDSFIKGLFSSVFDKYDKKKVTSRITINSNDYFRKLFEKNWMILQALYNV